MQNFRTEFDALINGPKPVLAFAPMQDVTDLPFWKLTAAYGAADVYFTEYFRVYPGSRLDRNILKSVIGNPTGRPVVAQMIGNDIPSLVRTARDLQACPVAAIDLNLGCPAPVVYRKCAGGGLLRDMKAVDAILGALRDCIDIRFTVKTRVGFESAAVFEELLPLLKKHAPDMVVVHGRTVRQMYQGEVRYDLIAQAAGYLKCPVLANGDINSAQQALTVIERTGARGVMLGRGAIRNPWMFGQIRQLRSGQPPSLPSAAEVLRYIRRLYEAVCSPDAPERAQVQRMKKYLNYIGAGIEPTGEFLHCIRRVNTRDDLFRVCETFLDNARPLPLEPFPERG